MNERRIFDAALEITDPQARRAFIENECAGNPELLAAVDALLKAHDEAGSFLNVPAVGKGSPDPANARESAGSSKSNEALEKTYLKRNEEPDDDDDSDDESSPDLSFLQPSSKPGSIGLLGHYEVLQVLGQGGFGIVFKAFDEKLHRHVAIKVMSVQMAATSPPRKRFLREARAAAAIRHENVVQVYSVEEQPLPYLVMEYIDGPTLKQKLDANGPLEAPEVLHIARQIASGLAAAQAMGLIHRDIKPGNILLERGAEQKVKITDFGLARAADDASLTRSGTISGTPMFMAPEQALGQTLDHRADLFSLGSVLYQMACGRAPFRAPTTMGVLRRVIEDTPRPLQEIIPEIPDWLVAIVTKLHAKKPEDRFQSAKEVADLLARCQSELQLTGKVTCVAVATPVAESLRDSKPDSHNATPATPSESPPPEDVRPNVVRPLRDRNTSSHGVTRLRSRRPFLITAAVIGIAALAVAIVFQRANHTTTANLASREASAPGQAESTDSTNPDRRAAEYVLSLGGEVSIKENDQERQIKAVGDLPRGAFELTNVGLEKKPMVSNAGLTVFKDCKNVKGLNLNSAQVSDEGLAFFKDCKNLGHLALSHTQISDAGLVHFAECKNLSMLYLNETKVSDAGLAHLKDCRNFLILNLPGTQVTDAALEQLADHSKLSFVRVARTKVTEAGVKKLSAALPGCKIEWDGGVIEPRTGWHGWPSDAPPPAIAPFDAEQAKQHQEAWAKYLGVPVEYTNSLGMKFRLIPPGEFLMGSTPEEVEAALKAAVGEDQHWHEGIKSEAPQHKVILTQPIYFGVHKVTQAQYEKLMGKNPSDFAKTGRAAKKVEGLDTSNHPVEFVSWNDAAEFCAKLSQQEQLKPFYFRAGNSVSPLEGTGYRLPTESEWEFACRAGTTTKYWSGDRVESLVQSDWVDFTSGGRTHPVGELKANPFRLYDLHGNVLEWMQDGWDPIFYSQFQEKPATDPCSPFSAISLRVTRGGHWYSPASLSQASSRSGSGPQHGDPILGFRMALTVDAVRQALKVDGAKIVKPGVPTKDTGWHGWPADAPPPAIAPFDAEQAKQHQAAWAKYLGVPAEYTNSLGMKFRLIPPGEFLMGSTQEEIDEALKSIRPDDKHWQECVKSEAPRHTVILTQPIYLGVNEVTQKEYEKVMGTNPSAFAPMGIRKEAVAGMETTDHPVEMVSWNDAADFCAQLSKHEKFKPFYFRAGENITTLDGTGYRLPSEAEWEFACRAGTATLYWIGDKSQDLVRAGWFGKNSGGRTHAVGELKPNPFGFYDLTGNVWEWVQDSWEPSFYRQFLDKPAMNPISPFIDDLQRVARGGDIRGQTLQCRVSARYAEFAAGHADLIGFRVSLSVDAVRQALKVDGAKIVKPGVPVGANGNPVAEQGRSAWDDLDPAQIPEAERVPRQPEGLVAVLGQHRRRVWSGPRSTSVSPDGTQFSLTTDDGLYLFGRDPKQPARFFTITIGSSSATFLPDGRIAAFVNDGVQPELQIFAKPRDGIPLEKQTATNSNTGGIIAGATASSDGRWLAANHYLPEDAIVLWRLGEATPQRAAKFVLPTPHGNISPGSFSPDAHWFCFTDNSNVQSAVHLIDLRGDTPREAIVLKADADEKSDTPAKGFEHAAFLSDGRLATTDRNGRTWFWKINDGEPQRVGSIRDTGFIAAAGQSLRMAVYPGDGSFRIWDLAVDPPQVLGTGKSTFPFEFDNIVTLAIAPDGETILTGHLNGAFRLWHVSKDGVTELDPLRPNPRYVADHLLRLNVIDQFLCSSLDSSRVGIWQPTRDGLKVLPEVTPSLHVLGASRPQRQLIIRESVGEAGTSILRCDADRVSPTRRITGSGPRIAALNDEGRRLAIGRHNGTDEVLELWGWESDDLPAKKLFEIKPTSRDVVQLGFAEAGRTLVGRLGGFQIQIWDVKDDQLVPRTKLPTPDFQQFALASVGHTLATVNRATVELWDLKSDLTKPTTSFAIIGTGAIAISPDGRRLAASFWENGASAGVQIINLASGVVEKRLTFPGRVHELTFTDDSRHLITGNANATIYVVRLAEPK